MITLPKDGIWKQPNTSDSLGDLWSSFNINTSENQGRLRLGKRMILNTGTVDVATITSYPCSFNLCGTAVHALAGVADVGYVFKNDGTMIGTFAKDVSAGAPSTIDSTKSDSVFSNNSLYVSTQDPASAGFVCLHKKTGNGAWSKITTTEISNASYPNMLCSYAARTYMTSAQSTIISLNSADAISYTGTSYSVILGVSGDFTNVITKPLPADDRIFILCVNTMGGKGHVYEWDGAAQTTSYDHRLESSGALSGIMFEGTPYIIDTNACLLAWNGGTFVEVARLNRVNNLPLYNPISLVNNRFVHPNGMTVVNGKIRVLIDNRNYDNSSTIEETIPSGVYEFDPKNPSKGMYHVGSVSSNKSTDIVTEYGQVRVAGVGALKDMGLQSTASGANGSVFAGATYYTDATTTKSAIFYDDRNDTLQKGGYLITSKIQAQGDNGSSALTNTWNACYSYFKKLLSATDKIVVKYRVTDVAPTEATITWTSTTTFTTTTDVSAYSSYECEVIQGIGSGKSTQITSVSAPVAGVYTVTVEDSFYGATGTSIARFQYWIKKDSIANQLYTSNKTLINTDSSWIQFKIFMVFTGKDEIEKFVIQNSINIKAE